MNDSEPRAIPGTGKARRQHEGVRARGAVIGAGCEPNRQTDSGFFENMNMYLFGSCVGAIVVWEACRAADIWHIHNRWL